MKTKAIILSSILFLLLIQACGKTDPNKQIDEGIVKEDTYHSREIGWTIQIPKSFSVVTKKETLAREKAGLEAIENSSGDKVNMDELNHLISFGKDKFNNFSSTSQVFDTTNSGNYQEANIEVCALLANTYRDQGIKADTTMGFEEIQGLRFNKFTSTIYGPDDEIILHQILYSRLIKGYDFGVNINYNNEEDKKLMLDAFINSKFEAH